MSSGLAPFVSLFDLHGQAVAQAISAECAPRVRLAGLKFACAKTGNC